jgi:hypothetical protein
MTKRIEKAIDIFLDAINNGTLAKGNCTACAVGNLVAHGLGGEITNNGCYFECTVENSHWSGLFITYSGGQLIKTRNLSNDDVQSNIKATDFTWEELALIEKTFETNTSIDADDYRNYTQKQIRADQIRGLEAVVKVMLQFDDCKDDVKEVFTNKAELICQ